MQWRAVGAGRRAGDHSGGRVTLGAGGEAVLEDLLARPQARGPRRRGDGAVAAHGTGRGRGGGRDGDEPARAAPPGLSLEAAALRPGPLRPGRRRPILGALHPATGVLVRTPRPRCRPDDVLAAVEALGAVRPGTPQLLGGDNAPPHQPHRGRDAARETGITLAFLPFRAPELMPLEEVWRGLKQTGAANRCYASLAELAERALAWLAGMSAQDRRRGLQTPKFDWFLGARCI